MRACFFAGLFLSQQAAAQQSRFSLGLRAGLNLSNANETIDYLDGKIGPKLGYQGGVTVEYQLYKRLCLQSGILVTAKGTKHRGTDLWIGGSNAPTTTWVRTTNLVYAQAPLRIAYKFPVASQIDIFVNAGGYYALGIAGKVVWKGKTNREEIPDKTTKFDSFGDERESFSKTDAGLGFGVGATYRRFSLGLDYEQGLVDIGALKDAATTNHRSYKNYYFALVLGYRLK